MPTLDSIALVGVAKELNLVSVLSYLFPLLVCVRRWHSLPAASRGLLVGALLIVGGLSVLSEVGRRLWHDNILFLYLLIWTETLFLSWIYYRNLHTRSACRLLLGAVALFVAVAVAELLYRHGLYRATTYTHVARSGLLIGAALLYFEQVLRELRNIRLERDPMFLLSVGVTLYYAGTLMVFVLEASMQQRHQVTQIWAMYIIESVLLIGFNVLLALALYRTGGTDKPQAVSPSSY
jgi:hypothetical protein